MGRADDLDALRATLADPEVSAVVITAPAGAGKTRLAREITRATALPPLWWQATEGAAQVPLGALAGVLDVSSDEAAATAFQRLAHLVIDAGGVVVVDDAPHLDARSADLLARLVASGKATVLATARAGVAVPSWLEWLWLDERTVHHELGPLGTADIGALVADALPDLGAWAGAEDAVATERVATALERRTGGNALFLRELLGDLRRARAAGRPLDLDADAPPHLLRVLDARLAAAGEGVRAVVEDVAVLGHLPLPVLVARCGVEAVDAAERAGYLEVDAVAVARPAHPLHAEAVLGAMSTVQRRDRTASVADALLAERSTSPTDRLQAVTALVALDRPVAAAHLVDAARGAFAALDHELAVRLAGAAVASGAADDDAFEARVVLGAAHSGAGRPSDAEAALRGALALARTDEQRARAAGRISVHLVAHGRRFDEAAAVLDEVAATIDDPQARSFLAADQAKLASFRGDLDAVAAAAEPDPDDELAVLNGAIVGAYAQAMAGDVAAARATIDRALPLAAAHRSVLPWSGELVRFSGVLVELLDAGPVAAMAAARAGLAAAESGTGAALGTWRYLHGFALAVAGRAAEADHELALADEELDGHDLIGSRPLAVATRAWAAAQLGDVEAARAHLDRCIDDAAADVRVRTQVAVADLWCDAVELDGTTSRTSVRKAIASAEEAAAGGQVLSAVLVLHELTRLGAVDDALEPLRALAADRPASWLLRFTRASARARATGDALGLERLARDECQRWPVAAAELRAAAAALHHRAATAGDPSDAAAAARADLLAHRLVASLGERPPWTLRAVASPLTAREAEVVEAVVGGATSRQVADAAGVSVRTVDNQLAAVYRKLGVAGRRGLAELLEPVADPEAGVSRGR